MSFNTEAFIAGLDATTGAAFEGNEVERLQVRAAARRLLARLETPYERAWGFCFEQPIVFAAIQTCIDLGLWKSWTRNGGGPKPVPELAKSCVHKVDENLLRRMLRLLAAFFVVEEAGKDIFTPTPFSLSIGEDNSKICLSLQANTHHYLRACQNLPQFLAKSSYKESTDVARNNYTDADPDGLTFFGRLQKTPEFFMSFNGHMEAWTEWKTPWTEIYDTSELVKGAKLDEGPLVVDLGGNTGIDISRVLTKHPDLPKGALVLQDLPEVIANVQVDEKITAMVHDFFTPQPVKGSRAYFMHAVLHDWPDEKAAELLANTKDAMIKDYSKLFIYEVLIPPTGASIAQTTMDVQMLSLLAASERTQEAWTQLLTEAGLNIVKFWRDPKENETLIEAMIA